jgi:predicted RNase H-like HicB family nuclease
MLFHVTLSNDEDGWIVAECPALPGCVSQGRDQKEALENIQETTRVWLWAEDQKAVELITGLLAQGWTEAEIIRNYPGLTIEDIRASERAYPLAV